MDELLASKSDISHTHDTRYYLKYQVDAKVNALGIDGYAKLEDLTTWANLKADKIHYHITTEEVEEMLIDIYGFVE